MSTASDFLKTAKKFVLEDLRIIFTFLFVIMFIGSTFAIILGPLAQFNAPVITPSYRPYNAPELVDSDKDTLPDIIEGTEERPCERGEEVRTDSGEFAGICTDTNPNKMDTDGDLFTDNMEDALGTNPTKFWNPGFIFIIATIYVIGFLAFYVYQGDPLKEYKEFEETALSSGVAGKGGKFAYGGSSVFGEKKASEVTEEERRQAIQQDTRFRKMTGESDQSTPKVKKKRNIGALLIQLSIAILIGIWIVIVIRQT